jgi:hypothetical protein
MFGEFKELPGIGDRMIKVDYVPVARHLNPYR